MPSSSSSGSSSGSGVVLSAYVQVGNNSSSGGAEEYGAGVESSGDLVLGQRTWDPSLADGLDSGWVSVEMTLEAGVLAWTVTGGMTVPLQYDGVSFQFIRSVRIIAEVQSSNCRMSWKGIRLDFYKNNLVSETIDLGQDARPVADTMGSSASSATASVDAVPRDPDNTKAVLSALVRLESGLTTLPAATAICGEARASVA